MTDGRVDALETLLAATEAAHGVFETTELKGVYDEAWPQWYAAYALDHGLAELVGHALTADELAGFLARSWDELRADPKPAGSWAPYTARRIAAEL